MSNRSILCWICGDAGTTGEHKIKRSDLHSVFGNPTQATPLYLSDDRQKNRPIGSLNSKILKLRSRLCAKCNNKRTQPHDLAWEKLSEALRFRVPEIRPGTSVRVNRIFRYDTARELLNVHLYFVKIFGCYLLEASIPIDISMFSNAILQEKANPYLYLKFGRAIRVGNNARRVGTSNVVADIKNADGSCAFATWFYYVGNLAVQVMYAVDGEERQGLLGAWHPRLGTNKLEYSEFEKL